MQPVIGIAYGDAKREINGLGLGVVEVSRIRRDRGALNQYARSGLRTDAMLIDFTLGPGEPSAAVRRVW